MTSGDFFSADRKESPLRNLPRVGINWRSPNEKRERKREREREKKNCPFFVSFSWNKEGWGVGEGCGRKLSMILPVIG